MYDVLIVGGGAAGYGAALTLASVEDKFDWSKDKKYMMLDSGNSDILKASFFNLAGVSFGVGGDTLLDSMRSQLSNYKSCDIKNDKVLKIIKENDIFKVTTSTNNYQAKIVILATGMHSFDIECDMVEVLPHKDIAKPNKIKLKNKDNLIEENLYVAGLASGVKTMFAIANGDGVKVVCDIFKLWTGIPAVAHDNLKDRLD